MTTIAGIMIIELEWSGLQNAFNMEFSSVESILLLLIFLFLLFWQIIANNIDQVAHKSIKENWKILGNFKIWHKIANNGIFFRSIRWYSQTGNHRQEDLAKFDCRPDMMKKLF